MPAASDPIAAVATAPGKGGIGVVRISGRDIGAVIDGIVGRALQPRLASMADFRDASGAAIDRGLALFFEAPRSFTGEQVLELQGHGGPLVQNLILRRALELGCRLAEPGEFTRRAFLNGKLDLAQAEAVADLIDAASARAARAALRSLDGEFSRQVSTLRERVVELRALIEATLDFPEEEIDFLERAQAAARVKDIRDTLAQVLQRSRQGARLRSGFTIVLAGRPNVGKSSLLNLLAGEEAAIVTAIPGTTRDAVARSITIDGMVVNVIDTAGLRDTRDEVEVIGIARTRHEIKRADLVLHVTEAGVATAEDAAAAAAIPADIDRLTVRNKIDMTGEAPGVLGDVVGLSAKTGAGIDALRQELLRRGGLDGAGEDVIIARERHLAALELTAAAVAAAAIHLVPPSAQLELAAEELRHAQEALNSITGAFVADDLLGEIFGRFCIGK